MLVIQMLTTGDSICVTCMSLNHYWWYSRHAPGMRKGTDLTHTLLCGFGGHGTADGWREGLASSVPSTWICKATGCHLMQEPWCCSLCELPPGSELGFSRGFQTMLHRARETPQRSLRAAVRKGRGGPQRGWVPGPPPRRPCFLHSNSASWEPV